MKIATTKTGYEPSLEKLLQAIDAAPLDGSKPFFKKLDDKEFYETQIMFAVRKRHTAKYHFDNIAHLLTASQKSSQSQSKAAALNDDLKSGSFKFTATVTKYTGAYGNELVAFLTALRSGLDFLTVAASRSILTCSPKTGPFERRICSLNVHENEENRECASHGLAKSRLFGSFRSMRRVRKCPSCAVSTVCRMPPFTRSDFTERSA